MKTIKELEGIRKNSLERLNGNTKQLRVAIGMGTCGISAGAKEVYDTFIEEINKKKLNNVYVVKVGCIGICYLEPLVEINSPTGEKVSYVKVNPNKAQRIIEEHLISGNLIDEYIVQIEGENPPQKNIWWKGD